MFSNVWSENTALFKRLMEIHSNSPKLYYGFNLQYARASAQNHHVFSFLRNVRLSQMIYTLSVDTQYSSVNIHVDITYQQGAINAKISLFGRCHMNYFGIKFTLFLKS